LLVWPRRAAGCARRAVRGGRLTGCCGQNAKRPTVLVDGTSAEVKFGKDFARLAFEDTSCAPPSTPCPPRTGGACHRCLLGAVLRMGAAGVRRWRVSFAPLARCRCNRAACPGGAIPSACVPAHARNRLALAFAQSGASPRHPSIAAQCRCDV